MVDVRPLAPSTGRIGDQLRYQRTAESLPLVGGINCRVEHESVVSSIPNRMDEAHKLGVRPRRHRSRVASSTQWLQPAQTRHFRPSETARERAKWAAILGSDVNTTSADKPLIR